MLTPKDPISGPVTPKVDADIDQASLPPKELTPEEQQKLWEALYLEQQQRRSCPGCGDDGGSF